MGGRGLWLPRLTLMTLGIRAQGKRAMRDRSRHHVYAGGYKLQRGRRYEFRAVLPDGTILLSGWFIAVSNNPVCYVF